MFHRKEKTAPISPERALYLRQTKRRRFFINLTRVGILAALFGLWEIAGNLGWIDSFIMSQPSRILKSLTNLYENGDLLRHIGISCLETIVGFLLGTIIGTLIATALWWSSFLSRVMEPYLVILNALPKVGRWPKGKHHHDSGHFPHRYDYGGAQWVYVDGRGKNQTDAGLWGK